MFECSTMKKKFPVHTKLRDNTWSNFFHLCKLFQFQIFPYAQDESQKIFQVRFPDKAYSETHSDLE